MKKHPFAMISATLLTAGLLFAGISHSSDDGGLTTLRGIPIPAQDTVTGEGLRKALDTDPLDRNYTEQPPLVSHAIDNYPITKEFNKCLDCHSWENYRKEKATKVSKTHFEAADGKVLSGVSARRYFCVQCHVPQIDAKPLVPSTYQRASSIR